MGVFPKGHKNEFERAVVNKLSGFHPLKVYSIIFLKLEQVDLAVSEKNACEMRDIVP